MQEDRLRWRVSQVLGGPCKKEELNENDIISCLSFDRQGNFLAVGDQISRVVFFEKPRIPGGQVLYEYNYGGEFVTQPKAAQTKNGQKSAQPGSPLESLESEDKVSRLKWLRPVGETQFMLTATGMTIKLWKIAFEITNEYRPANRGAKTEKDLQIPQVVRLADDAMGEKNWTKQEKREFPSLHKNIIRDLSVSPNGEHFMSMDHFQVNLWNIEDKLQAYSVFDITPPEGGEVSEILTGIHYHPKTDTVFLASTSMGSTYICDMRQSSQCQENAVELREPLPQNKNTYLLEVLSSVGEAQFLPNDQNYVITREFNKVRIWDIRKTEKAAESYNVFEPILTKLSYMYENNNLISERFPITASPCGRYIATGFFNGSFHVIDRTGKVNTQIQVAANKKLISREITPELSKQPIPDNFEYDRRIQSMAWHPKMNTLAVACLDALFIYNV